MLNYVMLFGFIFVDQLRYICIFEFVYSYLLTSYVIFHWPFAQLSEINQDPHYPEIGLFNWRSTPLILPTYLLHSILVTKVDAFIISNLFSSIQNCLWIIILKSPPFTLNLHQNWDLPRIIVVFLSLSMIMFFSSYLSQLAAQVLRKIITVKSFPVESFVIFVKSLSEVLASS